MKRGSDPGIVHTFMDERIAGNKLDTTIWFPLYLPHWSSRQASRATYAIKGGELKLSIPPEQPLWCADLHTPPLRVSCIQKVSLRSGIPTRQTSGSVRP